MSAPLLVLTGPGTPKAAAPWQSAAEEVGWRAELRPIARTVPVEIEKRAVDVAPPAWVAVASANAIPALARLWKQRPDLTQVPHAALGQQVARALEREGVTPKLVVTGDGIGVGLLTEALVEASDTGERILWPRGERSTDLREELVKAGRYVQAPVAYRSELVDGFRPPERADAVFFASPEAAQAWLRRADVPRTTAVAIGPSTYAELAPEYARFVKMLRLTRPRPEDLSATLVGMAPSRPR